MLNQKVNTLRSYLKTHQATLLISILILFYTVGTVGTQLADHKVFFLSLSPFNLLLSFAIAVFAIDSKTKNQVYFFIICYVLAMTAEWIGTATGYLFGSYHYGENLGAKLFGVPYVIGLNWWILLMGVSSITCRFKMNSLGSALAGALLMTSLDLIMEPVAIKSDFWHWKNGVIPVYNFICWFILSFILLVIQQKMTPVTPNKVHSALFLIVTLFFIIQFIF